jgi:cyclophilin family peptidyl-prolyl cis-trans isomerase
MIRFTRTAVALLCLSLVVVACGDDDVTVTTSDQAAEAGTVSTPEYLAFRAQPVACGAEPPAAAEEKAFTEPTDLGLTGSVIAILHTSCGDVTLELDPAQAPVTVNSFVFLAEQGYYDGTVSHRVYPGFMIQAGDPSATGRGGPGYLIADEFPPAGFAYQRGIVAMANTGNPNTGGSQFFMMLADYPLPPAYSVFGRVTGGLDVMDRIAAVPLTARGANPEVSSPLETVFIDSIEIRR